MVASAYSDLGLLVRANYENLQTKSLPKNVFTNVSVKVCSKTSSNVETHSCMIFS